MNALRTMIAISAVLVAGAGCGGGDKTPATSPAELTGATTGVDTSRDEMTRIQRERDEARAALVDERVARDQEHQRATVEATTRRQHDELQMRVIDAMASADTEIQTLRDKAAKANAKQRQTIERAITDAQQQKSKLNSDLRRLHREVGDSWTALGTEVEATLKQLDDSLSRARDAAAKK